MGRRGKILIKKIEDSMSRQVTFCKRKNGLLRKAEQLSILCGVEVGVIIFSPTNKLYEYSSSSMKLLFERYEKEIEANEQLLTPAAEAQLWKREADSLRRQLQDLQESYSQLKGENISGLGIEKLKTLENEHETSLKLIRTAKEQRYIEEIEDINRKEAHTREENTELRLKISAIFHENEELQKKVQEARRTGDSEGCSTSSRPFTKELQLL